VGELAQAIARIEGRFGVHAVTRGAAAERHRSELAIATGTSLDRVIGTDLAAGEPLAFIGPPSVGKLALALRAVAGAQAQGGTVAWVDPTASFDPLTAQRAGVDLDRVIVVRARGDGVALAAAAALRSEGFRLVVVDAGDRAFGGIAVDDLAPALPAVRGSPAALLVIAGEMWGPPAGAKPSRLAIPVCLFERVAWDRRHGRTVGWSFAVSRSGGTRRSLFCLTVEGSFAPLDSPELLAEVAV